MTQRKNKVQNIAADKQIPRSGSFLFWGNPHSFKEFPNVQDLLPLPVPVSNKTDSEKEGRSYGIGPNHQVHFYDYVHEAKYHSYEKIHCYQPISKDYVSREYTLCHEYKRVHEYADPWEYLDYVDYRPNLKRCRRKPKGSTYVKVKPKAK